MPVPCLGASFSNQIVGNLGLILDLPPLFTTLAPVSVILVVALTALVKTMTVVKNTVPVEPPEQVLDRLKLNGK